MHRTGRGGQFTYHGPGQRVAYVMLDVKRRFGDVRAYVASLEGWVIDSLAHAGCRGANGNRAGSVCGCAGRDDADDGGTHDKIAAIGVRLSRWVSSHGISLNVAPDLSHYAGIVPCGIRDGGVTSLADLGLTRTLKEVDDALRAAFEQRFGATCGPGTNLPDGGDVGQPGTGQRRQNEMRAATRWPGQLARKARTTLLAPVARLFAGRLG